MMWMKSKVPANDLAIQVGSVKAANIVALAAFVTRSKILDYDKIVESIKTEFGAKEKLINLNLEAMEAGRKAAQ